LSAGARADAAGVAEAESVINNPIAVVVYRVADLGCRRTRARRASHAALAVALQRAGRGARAYALCACAPELEPVVNHTITVVIDRVARLSSRLSSDRIADDPAAGVTDKLPRRAARAHARSTELAEPEPLVDLAVTVVVDCVAHLVGGQARRGVAPRAACVVADQRACRSTSACADRTRLTEREAIVDLAVAVIIFTVACLGCGRTRLNAARPLPACVAHDGALCAAGTDAHLTRRPQVKAVVDLAVAVIVEPIASLDGRCTGLRRARGRAVVAAGDDPFAGAGPNADGAGLAGLEAVVRDAVTVVVESIAHLEGRLTHDRVG